MHVNKQISSENLTPKLKCYHIYIKKSSLCVRCGFGCL